VSHNFDNVGGFHVRIAWDGVVRTTIAVAFAVTAAFTAAVTAAEAKAREVSASSYGFTDAPVADNAFERPFAWSLGGGPPCVVFCGPAFGTFVVLRSDVLTSNNADLSSEETFGAAGSPLGRGGMIRVERLEPDASALLMNWVVMSERTLDQNGSHSWSLMSGGSDAPWRPSELYRFESSSFAADVLGRAPPTPEVSTWIMMLLGFSGLGFAGWRNGGRGFFSNLTRKGAHA